MLFIYTYRIINFIFKTNVPGNAKFHNYLYIYFFFFRVLVMSNISFDCVFSKFVLSLYGSTFISFARFVPYCLGKNLLW